MTEITVILPVYNRIDQTILTLDKLLLSDNLGVDFVLEIIISDASPYNLLNSKLPKESAYSKIVYTKPSIQGIAASKNHAASLAKNPIIIFCDSDIEVERKTISCTLSYLKKNPTVAMLGGQVQWKGGPKDKELDRPRTEDKTHSSQNNTCYIESLYSRYIATYRDIFLKVGGYDQEVFNMRGEGSDLSVRYWRDGFPLGFSEDIFVEHIHEVEGGIIRNVEEPELDIAKDMLLLAYKYDMFDQGYDNFKDTINANFSSFHDSANTKIIRGILKNYEFICKSKSALDSFKLNDKSKYDFKFLEIFSNSNELDQCLSRAERLISPYWKLAFNETS